MTAYERAPGLLWRRTFDRVIILVPGSEEVVTLIGTGVDLWDEFREPRSLADLTRALTDRYGAPTQRVARDIEPVVTDLAEMGILRITSEHDEEPER